MAYNTKKMLEDSNGDLIPQYYDPVADEFKPLTNDPRDVRVTGSRTEEESLGFEEGIYNSSVQSHTISIPTGVKGAMLFLRASSLTGTFGSNEGVRLRARLGFTGNWLTELSTDYKVAGTFNGALLFYPGINLENSIPAFASSAVNTESISLSGFNYMMIHLDIKGKFGEGEGAHVSVNSLRWIY